jgi:hypothetical protein
VCGAGQPGFDQDSAGTVFSLGHDAYARCGKKAVRTGLRALIDARAGEGFCVTVQQFPLAASPA